mmetsp:Transcript_84249/g.243510  ORF Transcript_84249/g.243510 Transcript_84249/m.243510 type:complete len:137 (+) Transcript_84249:62-472(+)
MPCTSAADHHVLNTLVCQQRQKFPAVLAELEEKRRKTSCWIWWACPTELAGDCDPIGSYVTKDTAGLLLTSEASEEWRKVLEKLCELFEESGVGVLPRVDQGRVFYFMEFWDRVPQKPSWMEEVLSRFHKFEWPSW